MSHLPRKTIEVPSTAKKTQRVSRIAQPIRQKTGRDSTNRSSSTNRENNDPFLSSGIKPRQRSASASRTSATPMRTPLRTTGQYNASIVQRTAEKAPLEDKKWINAQTARINEYVVQEIPGIGKDFMTKGGIKSMSTKQFTLIVSHLTKLICGTKFKIDTNNYVDQLMTILPQIQYPYNMNKSSLKTINAMHSFGNVVALLGWLVDFAVENNIEEIESPSNLLLIEDEFSSIEYTKFFIANIKEGFELWNLQDAGYDTLRQQLLDKFIAQKTTFKSLMEVQQAYANLEKRYDQLVRDQVVVKNEQNMLIMDEKICNIRKQVDELEQQIHDKQMEMKKLKKTIKTKSTVLSEIEDRLDEHNRNIAKQQMSVTERDKLVDDLDQKKKLLNAKIDIVAELDRMGESNQITYSCLMKKQIELKAAVNNQLNRAELNGIIDNVNTLEINMNENHDQIESKLLETIQILESLKDKCVKNECNWIFMQQKLDTELQNLKYSNEILNEKIREITEKCNQTKEEFNRNTTEYQMELKSLDNEKKSINEQLSKNTLLLQEKTNEIEEMDKSIKKIFMDNSKLITDVESKCAKILKQQEDNLNQWNSAVDDAETNVAELEKQLNLP